jgi:N utilization substance protein B
MGKRRKARETTLQILFQLEFNDSTVAETQKGFWKNKKADKDVKAYSRWLLENIIARKEDLDRKIESVSKNWRLSRMAVIDRNILRMAIFELFHEENMAPAVVINEAIEIAKKYSGSQAANFINGILDALVKNSEKSKNLPKVKKNG